MSAKWSAFEHQIWRNFQDSGLQEHSQFALCISGGLDSMVLLHLFKRLKPAASVRVLHYHHGPSASLETLQFRDKCSQLVDETALETFGFHAVTGKSEIELNSEEDFRNSRWGFISSRLNTNEVCVTAHHLDDRLETILLKLIRGSSFEGVSAFKMWNQKVFRPLLNVTKNELSTYAHENKLSWVEDPTNQDLSYLRNWIRHEWLVRLEEKCPGGVENLGLSLDRLIENNDRSTFEQDIDLKFKEGYLDRNWFALLSKNEQLRVIAFMLRWSKKFDFTTGQLEEISKRLDKNQKEHTFELLNRKWVINATQIVIE